VRYVGGKSKIAKALAEPINADLAGRVLWEPFVGGLGMTPAFRGYSWALLSDACAPLITMYQAWDRGWRPDECGPCLPSVRDEALTFADSNPWKAFLRFGCGFGGAWDGGTTRTGLDWNGDALTAQAERSLERGFASLGPHEFECIDFCAEPTQADASDLVIYCDPPYAGTTGYSVPFDRDAFIERVCAWSLAGATVFVSEYDFPIGECILQLDRAKHMPGRGVVKERLYRC